jgi:hypothetical protein
MLLVTMASTVVMITARRDRQTVMNPNQDWREVARRLGAEAGGKSVVLWSRSPVYPVAYYLSSARVKTTPVWGGALEAGAIAADARGATRVFVVDDRSWWPLDEESVRGLTLALKLERAFSVGRVDVYRVAPR